MIRTLLKKKNYVDPQRAGMKPLTQWDFQEEYPHYPRLASVRLSQQEEQQRIDLAPCTAVNVTNISLTLGSSDMNPAPFKVQQNTPLPRVFRLFRTLGLRHLIAGLFIFSFVFHVLSF